MRVEWCEALNVWYIRGHAWTYWLCLIDFLNSFTIKMNETSIKKLGQLQIDFFLFLLLEHQIEWFSLRRRIILERRRSIILDQCYGCIPIQRTSAQRTHNRVCSPVSLRCIPPLFSFSLSRVRSPLLVQFFLSNNPCITDTSYFDASSPFLSLVVSLPTNNND